MAHSMCSIYVSLDRETLLSVTFLIFLLNPGGELTASSSALSAGEERRLEQKGFCAKPGEHKSQEEGAHPGSPLEAPRTASRRSNGKDKKRNTHTHTHTHTPHTRAPLHTRLLLSSSFLQNPHTLLALPLCFFLLYPLRQPVFLLISIARA